jgi:hydrogenase maturation factor HypF (carbamoyltransferase family)
MSYHKELKTLPRYYPHRLSDPQKYGFLCPSCNSRYGEPQPRGYIDVRRCAKCPTMTEAFQMDNNHRKKKMELERIRGLYKFNI